MIDKCLRRVLAVLTAALIVFLCVLCAVTIHRTHEEALAAEEEAAYWADYDFFHDCDDEEACYALWINLADQNPDEIDSYGLYVLIDNPEDLALIYNNFIVLTYESNPLDSFDERYIPDDEEVSIHDHLC